MGKEMPRDDPDLERREETQQFKLLKNPLPGPPRRSHVRMEFDLADPEEDEFDIEISEEDDFDI